MKLPLCPRLLACVFSFALAGGGRAQSIVQEYYVPMPEAQIRQSFLLLASNTGTTMDSVVSMVVGTSGTRIVYDQWEDGYEVDIDHPAQASTQIWGDGNDANGKPPGLANDPASLPSGTVIALRNLVTLPRNPATLLYDGRDRVGSTKGIAMSRSAWATTPGSVLADATEVNATIDWGSSFVMPIGQDEIFPTPATSSMFELVSLFVQASQNGTQVVIDPDGSGSGGSTTVTLNQGETYYLDRGVMKGATVVASKPVQVDLLTGDIGANYESRWFTIPPFDQWGTSYYTPVGTASDGDDTYIFLYNPKVGPITVNYTTRVGTGSFTIPAKNTYPFLMPQDSGAHFSNSSGEKFFAVGTVGAEPTANNVHDWGFGLVPEGNLTTALLVGWGPGSTDLSVNGSPVWVTAVASTRIYVDYNGDRAGALTDPSGGKYDVDYAVSALEVKRLFDPDKDQTGMRVYTLEGTLITGAWGQDPATSGPGNPYLDAGTTIPAFPVPVIRKSSAIAIDVAPAGLSIGDTLEYSVTMDNNSLVALGNLLVLDTLPAQLTYVAGSATRDGAAIADNADPTTLFPLDESGVIIPILPRGQSTTLKYRALINAGGTITNGVLSSYVGVSASETVVVPGGGSSPCVIHFTNSGGTTATTYNVSDGIYVQMSDPDANTNAATIQTVTVLVKNTTNGDLEYVTLTETGANTGVFLNTTALPSSPTTGLAPYDGTLNGLALDNLYVSYTDPVYGDSANATAVIAASTPTKILYLNTDGIDNDTTGGLDRVDPVATADATTSQTATFGASTIAAAATTSGSSSPVAVGGTLTFSHTPGTGADRILLVSVGVGSTTISDVTPGSVTQVTFGGTLMTKVGSTITSSTVSTQIYQLVNPASAAASVVVTLGGTASSVSASATTFTGVHQTTPLGTSASGTGTSTALSATVASATGELVFSTLAYDEGTGNQSITTSTAGGQAELVKNSGFNFVTTAASTKPGATSVTVSYTGGDSQQWAVLAVPLKPAPGVVGDSFTFTQVPNFAEAFSMPLGATLGVTSYLNVTSGSLSANPAITATVKHGATTLATLATPTATLLSRTGSEAVVAAVTSAGSNISVASGGTLSFSHTPGSGANRLLLVSVGVGNTSNSDATAPGTVTGVTFGGTAMTLLGSSNNGPVRNSIYSLVNPASAAANVVVSIGSKTSCVSGTATTLTGVDQITPLGTLVPNTSTSTALSATVASAAGELVYSAAAIDEGTTNQSITTSTTGSQVQLVRNNGFNFVSTASSTKPGAASVTVNYTSANSQAWSVLAVAVKPAPTPPAIYRLDWSAPLASAVTVPSGEAIELSIANASSAGFAVLYDSSTYPSKITLPTSTVIHVDSIGVYDAPYAGGSLIPTPTNGQTVYLRVVVGDPFGAYDITSLPVTIDGPGTTDDLAVTLGASNVVATTASSKTYEYVWHTGATAGAYTITATGDEGFEGTITSQRSTSVTLGFLDLGTPSITEFTNGDNGPGTLVYAANASVAVRVTDIDQNMNPLVAETVTAVITSSSGDSELVTLTETGPDTGVFTCVIAASSSVAGASNDGTLYAPQGSALLVNYVDPNDSSDTSSDSATVPLAGDIPGLGVTKTLLAPSDGQAMIGEGVQYLLRTVNIGSTTLASVSLTDTFPAAKLSYNSASVSPNTVASGSLTWTNIGPLSPGQSVDIIVDFTALATGSPVTNSVTADAGGGATSTSSANVIITRPGVTVTKTLFSPNPGPASKGGNVVFDISVHNTGDTAISSLPLEDIYSGTVFEFVSATLTPDAAGSGSLLWLDITGAGSLAADATQTITVTLKAIGAANPASNLAAVNYAVDTNGDPVPPSTSTATVVTQAASILGSVLEDKGTAGFSGDDTALFDVKVSLYTDPNGDGNPADGTLVGVTRTLANGTYEFLNLGLGKYTVVEEDPFGYSSIADTQGVNDNRIPVDVVSSTIYPGNKFLDALVAPSTYGSISGQVLDDIDADGDPADGDAGISAVTVDLYTDPNGDGNVADGVLYATTTTSGSGNYSFTNLPPGTYVVVETDPSGYVSTADVANPNDNQIPVTVAASTAASGKNFLDTTHTDLLGSLGNQIWSDTNNNGIFDSGAGEAGLDGVLVQLYLSSQTPGVGSPYLSTTSSGGGTYQFSNVPAGSYLIYIPVSNFGTGSVLVNTPLSSIITDANDNGENGDDNGIQGASGAAVTSPTIVLSTSETENSIDFGFVPNGSLGNRVFDDHNNDGNMDALEHGIAGVRMVLFAANESGAPTGSTLQVTTTDEHGDYRFDGLVAGSYVVVVDKANSPILAGYVSSTGHSEELTLLGDMLDHGKDTQVTVDTVTDGIAAVKVTLGLGAQPTNEVISNAPGAGQHGPNGDLTDNLMLDFGFTPTYSLGNRVFLDNGDGSGGVAGDGIQNGTEAGVGSVSVDLKDAGGSVVATTTTDSSGYYRFDSRLVGTYTLFLPSSNFGTGQALVGTLSSPGTKTGDQGDKGVDNSAPATNGIATASITVSADAQPVGETVAGAGAGAHGPLGDDYDNLTIDFGVVAAASYPCSIGSLVWHDANNNGIRDASEDVIGGVAIEVWSCDAGGTLISSIATTTTASDGTYFVGNLAPGTYKVKIPAGNFGAGQALAPWTSSSGTTVNLDNQIDNDDNGVQTAASAEVLSPVISLAGGSEPVDGVESGLGATLDNGGVDANGDMTVDFGFYSVSDVLANLCSLGSLVWNDTNNNGQWDSGEPGIAGATLELYRKNVSDLTYWASTTSAVDGTYFFDDLPSGNDWMVRIPASNFTGSGVLKAYPRTSGSPDPLDNQEDGDNNGIQAGGIGTEVWSPVITLTKLLEPTTGETGAGGAQDDAGSYLDANGDMTVDFGFGYIATYSLGNHVYRDPDDDGQPDLDHLDSGPIPGVTMKVFAADVSGNPTGSALATVITDSAGYYRFDWLVAGTYVVVVDKVGSSALDLYRNTSGTNTDTAFSGDLYDHGIDTPLGALSVLPGGIASGAVALGSGLQPLNEATATGAGANGPNGDASDNLVIDFGFTPLISIGNRVFADANSNGIMDGADAGIDAVTLKLFAADVAGDPTGAALATAITDTGGYYRFDGLATGKYVVIVDRAGSGGRLAHYGSSTGASTDMTLSGEKIDHGKDVPLGSGSVLPGGIVSTPVTMGGGVLPPLLEPDVLASGNGAHGPNTDDADNLVLDFGFHLHGAIAGTVRADTDGDGSYDTPLAGVTVTLQDSSGNDIDSDPVAAGVQPTTTLTAADGSYGFADLEPGSYRIAETQPGGYRSISDKDGGDPNLIGDVTLVAVVTATTNSSNDFVEQAYGAISGSVLADTDNDNVGETGLSGVTVTLFTDPDGDGNPADGTPYGSSVTTDVNGLYAFSNVAPGTYVVVQGDLTGYASVADGDAISDDPASPADAGNSSQTDNLLPVNLQVGETDGGNGFVDEQYGTIAGTVLADSDNNGTGDTGIGDVTVTLWTDPNGDGDPVDGTAFGTPATTAAGGSYNFASVPPGSYVIVETQPAGFLTVTDGDTTTDTDGSPADAANSSTSDNRIPATIMAGETDDGNGFVEELSKAVSGTVYRDANNDSLFGGDVAQAGVVVELYAADGTTLLASTVTDANGNYTFAGLPHGDYVVKEIDPAGSSSVLDSDGNGNGDNTIAVTLALVDNTGRNFLDTNSATLAAISGSVYDDGGFGVAGDGGFAGSPGDAPIPGVLVSLYRDLDGNGVGEANELVQTTATAGNGGYSFAFLPNGSYLVVETDPSGATSVLDTDNLTAPQTATDNRIAVVLAGTALTSNNFLDDGTSVYAVSGAVYDDANADTAFGGDVPLSGVTVKLYADVNNNGAVDAGDVLIATQTTGGVGNYGFTNLPNGNYLVVETDSPVYTSVTDSGEPDTANDDNTIDVTVNNASSTDNSFLDASTCPNTWAQWQLDHPTAAAASGNLEADAYDNLAEFAFAMLPDSGAGNAWSIQPGAGGTLTGVFIRPRSATENVTYTLQAATTLGTPTVWEDIIIPPNMITVADNGSCFETVTFLDLETLTEGRPFVRIKAALDETNDAVIEHTSYTEVEGWQETSLEACRSFNNPFLRETAFTGTVGSVSDQTLTLDTSLGTLSLSSSPPSYSYYLEVTSGTYVGHRFDVLSASGSTVILATDASVCLGTPPFNTATVVPDLADATVVIRSHWTLGELFPVDSFVASGDAASADQVQTYAAGAWTTYWLKTTTPATWVKLGGDGTDQGSTVLPPGQGLFALKRNPAITMLGYGEVRAHAFVRPLCKGLNLVGGGYPLDQSANGAGGRAMSKDPAGFFGSRDFKSADSFYLWQGDAGAGGNGYDTYYLLHSVAPQPVMTRWVKVGDAKLSARDTELSLLGGRSVFIRAAADLHGYTIPTPWTP